VRVLVLRSVDGLGGGAEAIVLRTAANVDRERVRMTVCCIHRQGDALYDFDHRAAELGIDYCGVTQQSILARGVFAAVQETAARRRVQIVDAQDYKAAFLASRLARSGGVRPVATLHGWSGQHWRERLVYYPAERLIVRRFPLAIAVSGPIRDTLVRWGGRPERIQVLPNGIDPAAFRRQDDSRRWIRASLGIAETDVVVGAVGRVEQEKRFDVLLEAMARLLPRRPDLRLVIVGEGSLKARLNDQMGRLGIADRCHLVGHRHDVVNLYQAFDVFVQSSDREGSPTVVVEAMAMEVPVVATEVGGTRELVRHEVHGLLVPRRSPSALADAVEQTLCAPDATARRVAAARARVVNELSFDARTRRLERMYLDLMEEGFYPATQPRRGGI
jgi:glycosyltransferase involved in cell wall biosynthesis